MNNRVGLCEGKCKVAAVVVDGTEKTHTHTAVRQLCVCVCGEGVLLCM
jgi:hypothetical protein